MISGSEQWGVVFTLLHYNCSSKVFTKTPCNQGFHYKCTGFSLQVLKVYITIDNYLHYKCSGFTFLVSRIYITYIRVCITRVCSSHCNYQRSTLRQFKVFITSSIFFCKTCFFVNVDILVLFISLSVLICVHYLTISLNISVLDYCYDWVSFS